MPPETGRLRLLNGFSEKIALLIGPEALAKLVII
jgi:hypothetical protein